MPAPSTPPTGKQPSTSGSPLPATQMKAMLPWIVFIALLGLAAVMMSRQADPRTEVPYFMPGEDSFTKFVEDGRILKCDIVRPVSGAERIEAEYTQPPEPPVRSSRSRVS